MKSENIPHGLWRLVLAALLGAILSILLLLVLALAGISNPRHIGTPVIRDELDRDTGWVLQSGSAPPGTQVKIDDGVYRIVVSGDNERAFVLAPYPVQPTCTVMIAARQTGGPRDAGYGLWWGDEARGDYHVAAVNGDGYLTVFRSGDGKTEAIMEWQVFPRIHPQGEANTLQVDIEDGQVLVRVNDEVAVRFEWTPVRPLGVGFYVETLSAGETTVDFDWLAIWQEVANR